MAELPFSDAEIEQLVVRYNAVMAKEQTDIPDLGGNATDDEVAATLQETAGDLSRDELTEEIENMNDEQQDASSMRHAECCVRSAAHTKLPSNRLKLRRQRNRQRARRRHADEPKLAPSAPQLNRVLVW